MKFIIHLENKIELEFLKFTHSHICIMKSIVYLYENQINAI